VKVRIPDLLFLIVLAGFVVYFIPAPTIFFIVVCGFMFLG
jgi:hypothetical protein